MRLPGQVFLLALFISLGCFSQGNASDKVYNCMCTKLYNKNRLEFITEFMGSTCIYYIRLQFIFRNCISYCSTVAGQVRLTIESHPVDQLDQIPGMNVIFTVIVTEGDEVPIYFWLKDGVQIMEDAAKYAGLGTPILTVINVEEADEGNYGLFVVDAGSPIFSNVAQLTVCK